MYCYGITKYYSIVNMLCITIIIELFSDETRLLTHSRKFHFQLKNWQNLDQSLMLILKNLNCQLLCAFHFVLGFWLKKYLKMWNVVILLNRRLQHYSNVLQGNTTTTGHYIISRKNRKIFFQYLFGICIWYFFYFYIS